MSIRRILLAPATLFIIVPLAILSAGCSKKSITNPRANIRPTIELTRAPYNQSTRFEYSYRMDWLGYDPDGRIDHYLYAIDPPSPTAADPEPDTAWVSTLKSEELINFSATKPDSSQPGVNGSSDFHTFVVKAIDNGGLQSTPLYRSFFTYTVAPTVMILQPPPSDRGRSYVTPAVRINWTGTDDDGIFDSKKPVKYKFIMLTNNSPVPVSVAISTPDSVRRYYAPMNWAGWDSTSGDTTEVQYTNLVPQGDYLFVVVAFDEAGAYSPVFSLNGNMLALRVTFAAAGGPLLTIFNSIFTYTYKTAAYSILPQYQIPLEVGAGQPIPFYWTSEAGPGATVKGYRWALDISDPSDETPRDPPATDFRHWSDQALGNTQALVGPFGGGENHLFYVESEDNNGLKSLGIVNLTAVLSTLSKPLGIVNDTRGVVDTQNPNGSYRSPTGRWPDTAELDTFLFARGGYSWKGYPAGSLSSPGLFAGYSFDTINTRLGRSDLHIPLATIGQYAHLIWITDAVAAINTAPGTQLVGGQTALRYMTSPGNANSIAAYVSQGGQLWLTGGGIAYASLSFYNKSTNDPPGGYGAGKTFTTLPPYSELVPGRMMFDLAHWQSEIKVAGPPNLVISRTLARYDSFPANVPTAPYNYAATYAHMPIQMRLKSPATDPLPPLRSSSDFYSASALDIEYLSQPNWIQEDLDPSPLTENLQSTLDTVFSASQISLVQNNFNVCMTIYHGLDTIKPIIFTGFSFWRYTRQDAQDLVDAVLQNFWGLTKSAPSGSSRLRPVATVNSPISSPPAVTMGAPSTGAMVHARVRDR